MNGIENHGNGGPKDKLPNFINEQVARVTVDGSASPRVETPAPDAESKLGEILDKLQDPNVSIAEALRLIPVEIGLLIQEMGTNEANDAAASRRKSCLEQIGALRVLAKVAKEADAGAKRDVLNFDGPKFKFVLGEMVRYFKEAALTALRGDTSAVNNIMKEWRDLMAINETELRRQAEKIGYDSNVEDALPRLASREGPKPGDVSKDKIPPSPKTSP
jgi:hypothetical protein